MYTVYAIYNVKHNKFYIGQTKDLAERIKLHNARVFKGCYTSRFDGEWQIVYNETVATRQDALIRENNSKVLGEEGL
ncbi:MAG TPA: GIY-YIG nuclease family protein [Candidatus Paceibacterota bacterium]|nr:GIY-YIG nuclease family protein [Candidatus Paceibacterota bacterium]